MNHTTNVTSDDPLTYDKLRRLIASLPPEPKLYASKYVPRGTGYELRGPGGAVTMVVNDEDAQENGWPVDDPRQDGGGAWARWGEGVGPPSPFAG